MFNQRCYLCNKKDVKPVYKINNRMVYCCLNDDLFFSIDEKKEKFHYNYDYFKSSPYNQRQIFNNAYFQEKLDKIMTLAQEKRPTFLDVGCGWGNFLQVIKNSHLPYLGIDFSSRAVEICREKKLNCQKADIINLSKIKGQQYSAITFFQVIEHIKNPLDYLKAAKKLLKKNGVLLLTTPNNHSPLRHLFGSNWSVYQTPSHYFFYSSKSLERLLKAAGFSNFKIKIDRFRFFSLDYVLQRIFKKKLSVPQIINFPIPTDPWGDLEAVVIKK
ncbi:MAG: Methyltransferase domain family [Candidatus Roizmanbacteria bacterium GW2011_GWA2_32_13]|uniref:Methyltransferase domain family n=1 Tax=Candidatus Roizmanbacteria bacterium GW2011_GWA2_32_13 TaxID=1618475 RepID=A0A0F9ZFB2_9BACT|nr:MAG: Methyltransferase domain family [Candidatus Roizmanbacteria bacterium GW2011_GWA2_32_13]